MDANTISMMINSVQTMIRDHFLNSKYDGSCWWMKCGGGGGEGGGDGDGGGGELVIVFDSILQWSNAPVQL